MKKDLKLIFLNHACFIVEYKDTKILIDPYLSGSAFNNGWSLLKEFDHSNHLKDITHIYYSHEHPDHFSVPFLKKIDTKMREKITIIYQKTFDKRVKFFCEKLGYKFKEFQDSIEEKINNDFHITIGKVPFYDSWINFKINNQNILNINDCVFKNPNALHQIKKKLKNIDVLFTQFSYANYIEEDKQAEIAAECLKKISLQDKILKPKYIIPFASFIYFSHKQNKHMNRNINTTNDVLKFILNNCEGKPIILKANETWELSEKENQDSIKFWQEIYNNLGNLDYKEENNEFSTKDLVQKSKKYIEKINSLNNKFLVKFLYLINFIPKIRLYLNDVDKFFTFDVINGLEEKSDETLNNKFIELDSNSLAFIFDYDFGYDTLLVNARFKLNRISLHRINRCFFIGPLNNTGRYIKFNELFKYLNLEFIFRGLEVIGFKR